MAVVKDGLMCLLKGDEFLLRLCPCMVVSGVKGAKTLQYVAGSGVPGGATLCRWRGDVAEGLPHFHSVYVRIFYGKDRLNQVNHEPDSQTTWSQMNQPKHCSRAEAAAGEKMFCGTQLAD